MDRMIEPKPDQSSEQGWDRIGRELDELRDTAGMARVVPPGWRPVSFDVGRRWAWATAAQGFYVECQADGVRGSILLKVWEYGQDEPSWEEVRTLVRPSLTFNFETSEEGRNHCESVVDELVSRFHVDEAAAALLVDAQHLRLAWRTKAEIDLAVDGSAEWWAEQLMAESPAIFAEQREAATPGLSEGRTPPVRRRWRRFGP
jgi:hypothetical protein